LLIKPASTKIAGALELFNTAILSRGISGVFLDASDVFSKIHMTAFIRKMALNGYVLHVDLSPVQEIVSLQRRCSNNLNQIAKNVNTYGALFSHEITALQRDYAALWKPLSDLLKQLAEIMNM